MLKNYICFTGAFIVFVISILFLSTYTEINPLIFMFSLGVMFSVFLLNAGFNKRDFDERKYKKIIRGKNKQIKGLEILNMHATQAANDFFKELQNYKNCSVPIDFEKQNREFEKTILDQELKFRQELIIGQKNDNT